MTSIDTSWNYSTGSRYGSHGRAAEPAASFEAALGQNSETAGQQEQFADAGSASAGSASRGAIPVSSFRLLSAELVPIVISELLEEEYQIFIEQDKQAIDAYTRLLENQYTEHFSPDLTNDPRLKDYATITVGGKVVAQIDNQGVVMSYDDFWGKRISDMLESEASYFLGIASGPATAQARADKIVEIYGGRITIAASALTQKQYNAMPPIPGITRITDYEAMRNDPLFDRIEKMVENLEKTQREREDYLARSASATASPS